MCVAEEQLFVYGGLLREDGHLRGAYNGQHDLLVGIKLECSAPRENLIELMKGELTDSIVYDICVEFNGEIGS